LKQWNIRRSTACANELIIFYPTRRQMATASAYYSEWAELPLLFLSRLFG